MDGKSFGQGGVPSHACADGCDAGAEYETPADLTAGNGVHFDSPKCDLVIDKVALVLPVINCMRQDGSKYWNVTQKTFYGTMEKIFYQNDFIRQADGGLYSDGYKSGDGIHVGYGVNSRNGDTETMRIEWNPKKSDPAKVSSLFSIFDTWQIEQSRVTRIDIAVDYPLYVNPVFFWDNKKQKVSCMFSGKHGIETLYLGVKTSDSFFRIYDKGKELRDNNIEYEGELTRVECQEQKGYHFYDYIGDPFKHLAYSDLSDFAESRDYRDIQFLSDVLFRGLKAALLILPRRIKMKTVSRFRGSAHPNPSQIFDKYFSGAWDELRKFLLCSAADAPPDALQNLVLGKGCNIPSLTPWAHMAGTKEEILAMAKKCVEKIQGQGVNAIYE